MNIFKHVEVGEQLLFLRPTLMTWVDRVEQISRSFPQSPDQYYLEPTLVGLLAGAAWSNGIHAITEVKVKRTGKDRRENGGRLDLLMLSGEHRVALEAKIIWDWTLIQENVMDELQNACNEVSSIQDDIAELRIGALFFVPWWNNKSQQEQLSGNVVQPLSQVRVDVKACYCNSEFNYPGAILLWKLAHRL